MPRAAGSNIRLCSPSLHKFWADIQTEDHSPHKAEMNHGNNWKFAPGPIIQTVRAHSTPKDTTLFTVLFAWHGHCLLEASRLTYVAGRNTKYTHTHTHTHARTHVRAHTHACTNIPQELICTPTRAGNGGRRREIIVATSRVLWVDRPWLFYWLHRGGVRAWSSLVCSLLCTALRSIWSTLPFLLNTQSPLRSKNLHILHWIFKFEQSLRTQRNWVIVKKVAIKFCLSFL